MPKRKKRSAILAAVDATLAGLHNAGVIRLSVEDQQRFAAALIDPPPPNATLQRAVRHHRARIQQR